MKRPGPPAIVPGVHPNFGTISSFLTDGSLAALCAAITRLTGVKVALIDPQGRTVSIGDDQQPWHVLPADGSSAELSAALEHAGLAPVRSESGHTVIPLTVRGGPIGALVVYAAEDSGLASRELLEFAVEMLASTVAEFCEQSVEINQRHSELRTLFRLSSLLVASRDMATILGVVMRSAIEVFSMDGAMIHLAGEDPGQYGLAAHVGVPGPFAEGARKLLGTPEGAVTEAGRDLIVRLSAEHGYEGLVTVSLTFKDQAKGVLRLFSRESRLLDPSQHALLQTIAEQAAAAVAGVHMMTAERESAALRRQIELAGEVQHRMLPQSIPSVPSLDIATRYQPSFELSGDFFDLIELGGHLGVAVGDVSGKGVPAALLMAATRATLRAHAADVFHLDELMARVNRAIARDTLPQEFVTLFYGVIDPKTLRLTYCNAGHDPPLVIQRAKGGALPVLYELTAGGMIVGIDAEQKYERGLFDLSKGDYFVACTDGLSDAMNFQGRKFGRERLKATALEFLRSNPTASAALLADHLVWEVRRFVGMNPQTDDITLVVLRAR